ncbi:MAG: NYN domain-containing protein [Gemmatimonadota bacterium]|nr:NYN domain-containing protein [Gemmatimonadota bacterium]MDH5758082.1 NYN domain-containing protein [Gemmatimonadota bacterium]
MGNPYSNAPHAGSVSFAGTGAPHAALLIDFDNVTMGMRSDLSKELKNLLASDVIKGKVSVQRAYADWRRYPQYIVPLSEASVDLIFAPAYGSNKKNATDIRMAIDALELVFIRPEIGTYILLTGDSDFSSLVLKLKEYGKYVIGVGIQESTSDILVQNCDEYYSYTSLTGLKKTTEADQRAMDPWVLVSEALKKMVDRKDVMRSDRLKQVMQEMDSSFDEGGFGFSKFSKFLAEASSRGLIKLQKMENGQYEVGPVKGGGRRRRDEVPEDRGPRRDRDRDRGRGRRDRERRPRGDETEEGQTTAPPAEAEASGDRGAASSPVEAAFTLLAEVLAELRDSGRDSVRDSDLKRRVLERDPAFDETELGFGKFSKFLEGASDARIVDLRRNDAGNIEVSLPRDGGDAGRREAPAVSEPIMDAPPPRERVVEKVEEIDASSLGDQGLRLGPRRGTTRRRGADEALTLFEGQAVPRGAAPTPTPAPAPEKADEPAPPRAPTGSSDFDATALGLPTDPSAILRYLAHRYKGVGEKTAEGLVERFGADLFRVLRDDPEALSSVIGPKRAEQVLAAWNTDYARRTGGGKSGGAS